MCGQSLRCLKSKYSSFFSPRWVSRYAGTDVILLNLLQPEEYLQGGDSRNSDSNSRDGLP